MGRTEAERSSGTALGSRPRQDGIFGAYLRSQRKLLQSADIKAAQSTVSAGRYRLCRRPMWLGKRRYVCIIASKRQLNDIRLAALPNDMRLGRRESLALGAQQDFQDSERSMMGLCSVPSRPTTSPALIDNPVPLVARGGLRSLCPTFPACRNKKTALLPHRPFPYHNIPVRGRIAPAFDAAVGARL